MTDLPKFFGIDMGYDSVKICEVELSSNNEVQVSSIGKQDVKNIALERDPSIDADFIIQNLGNMTKASGITTKNCVITIPETSVFTRFLTLPQMEPNQVSEAIYWGLKTVIPVSLDSVNISYLKVNEFQQADKVFINWYVVAAPKELVATFGDAIKKSGFNLLAVETESLANTRAVRANYDLKGDVVIFDFGAHNSNIILIRNGHVAFSQTVEVGSDILTKAIASDFGVDMVQAEAYKIGYGLEVQNGDARIAKSITPSVDMIVTEISRAIVYFKDKLGGNLVNTLFLTGGGANLKQLDAYISTKLSIQCAVANSFNKVKIKDTLKNKLLAEKNLNNYNVVLGLALKGYIND